jgi:coenzyme F420-reducing hydrogenase beta subunit
VNVCPVNAIVMKEDDEGFVYPFINQDICINCHKCVKMCPHNSDTEKYEYNPLVYGGSNKNKEIKQDSTSGGIFSAIVEKFYTGEDCYIFGAVAHGLKVCHEYVNDISEIGRFRKSKYAQSDMSNTYENVRKLLSNGKKVLFSGTPCHVAALKSFLEDQYYNENLLTVDVVCEGIPSPLLIRKQAEWLEKKYSSKVVYFDYRFKDKNRWDYQVGKYIFEDGRELRIDRWFNPFWVLWARRLMSRPSCVQCPFRTKDRVADITLGDLWGCQNYCPELYDNNEGAGLVFCNSARGKALFRKTIESLNGHELMDSDALKYQRPMYTIVPASNDRDAFMEDLKSLDYPAIIKKWKAKEPIKVLFKKYIIGSNKQIVMLYKIKERMKKINKTLNIDEKQKQGSRN